MVMTPVEGETMAGFKLVTDLDPEKCLEIAWRAAQDLGFRLGPVEGGKFSAKRGHAVLSAIGGPLAPHCNFEVSAARYGDGTTDVVLETNSPWLTTGWLGSRKVAGRASELADKIAEALKAGGATIRERKEIP